jgi:hypothetical protein
MKMGECTKLRKVLEKDFQKRAESLIATGYVKEAGEFTQAYRNLLNVPSKYANSGGKMIAKLGSMGDTKNALKVSETYSRVKDNNYVLKAIDLLVKNYKFEEAEKFSKEYHIYNDSKMHQYKNAALKAGGAALFISGLAVGFAVSPPVGVAMVLAGAGSGAVGIEEDLRVGNAKDNISSMIKIGKMRR